MKKVINTSYMGCPSFNGVKILPKSVTRKPNFLNSIRVFVNDAVMLYISHAALQLELSVKSRSNIISRMKDAHSILLFGLWKHTLEKCYQVRKTNPVYQNIYPLVG